jgi:polyhydroxyalkanoate synthesis repressor PhaR
LTHANGADDAKIVIKKYANRRLYDTSASAYVTLEHLSELVRQGKEFTVQDAKTVEQENRKEGVLPVSFLRQLIQFYGDSFQSMLPAYLELSMKSFTQQQEKWREYMTSALGSEEKAKAFDDQVRKNMAMFEDTMKFFAPFVPGAVPGAVPPTSPRAEESAAKPAALPTGVDAIRALQQQMLDMQKQLAQLATGSYVPSQDKDKP